MDNIENYFYIALAVIYIISRVIKASSKQKQQQRPAPPRQPQSVQTSGTSQPQQRTQPKKSFSFEDILKEFEKNLAGEEYEEDERPLPVEEIRHEKPKPVKVEPANRPSIYETFEGTSYETPEVLEASRKEKEEFARSDNYTVHEEEESEFIKMLRQPNGAKNAIVLSEIINRKYF